MNQRLQRLRGLGQSLWLDNITRDLLDSGTLARYIDEYGLTGLTSNPTIFDEALAAGTAYDAGIRDKHAAGMDGEALFTELALEDLRRAADLFQPAHRASNGVDGWVSMELSPLLASDTDSSIEAASRIHRQGARENLFIKIPGTPEGVPAIEESIHNGVPINVTLLFSAEQYIAVAEAYMRAIERRIEAGLDPAVSSVASLFVSRWDKAIADRVPDGLRNGLGIAVGQRTYRAYREMLASDRCPIRCTPPRSQRRIPSTPCQRRLCVRSRTTANSMAPCARTAAIATRCWRSTTRPASTSMRWRYNFSRKAPRPSPNRGGICCNGSTTRSRPWPHPLPKGNARHEARHEGCDRAARGCLIIDPASAVAGAARTRASRGRPDLA
jgi:transaldolase